VLAFLARNYADRHLDIEIAQLGKMCANVDCSGSTAVTGSTRRLEAVAVRILAIFLLLMLGIGRSYAAEPAMTPWVQFAQTQSCTECQRDGYLQCRKEEGACRGKCSSSDPGDCLSRCMNANSACNSVVTRNCTPPCPRR
jgi:hypothetical protein